MRFLRISLGVLLVLAVAAVGLAEEHSAGDLQLHVEEFTIPNGMLFLVVERHATPQVACRVAVRAGSALEEAGKTGIAHMLEHMMFKGTKNFGSLDPERHRELRDGIEQAYQAVQAEKMKRHPDLDRIETKLAEMEKLQREAREIYVPQAFSLQLGKNGATRVNAFTTTDQTQYTASVPSDMLEQWFSITSEQLFEPAFREFYVEREVIQREWAFRYVNNADGAGWLDLNATAFAAHPYGNPVIGWKGDMENFTLTDAEAFHRRYYNPGNAVCVLVGDVTKEKAREFADIYFARYPAGPRSPERVTEEPPQKGPRKSIRFLDGARKPLVRIGFHAARIGTKEFYALDAMTMVLTHGRSARMEQNLVERGLAVEAWSAHPDNRYGGMFILGGSPNEPAEIKKAASGEERRGAYLKACEELEERLLEEAEKLRTEPVSDRELSRIKKLTRRDFLDGLRSNESLAGTLATLEVQVGWNYFRTYLENISEVTAEDIQSAARRFVRPEARTTAYVIPGGESESPAGSYAEVRSVSGSVVNKALGPESRLNRSVYPTPAGWKHPLSFERKPEKIKYPDAVSARIHGTQIFCLEDHELPLIDLTLLVRAGSVDVEKEKMGLSALLEYGFLKGGTEAYTPRDLAMVLDENAMDLSVSVGEEMSVIRLSVMKPDWDQGLSVLREILARPRFDPEALRVAKEKALISLKRQGGNARAVAFRESEIWHFEGHPYGRDPLKGLETIPAIGRDDLREFMDRYFVPRNMVIAVAGDMEEARIMSSLQGFLDGLPSKSPPGRHMGEPDETPPVLGLIHKPGQVQSQIVLVLPGVKRTHPGYWKLNLLATVFGGGNSVLYKRLREDLGLVYAAWFYQGYKWHAGMLKGYIGCKGSSTRQALEETVNIMGLLRDEVPQQLLEQERMDALNSFVFNVDTPSDLSEAYARYHLRGEPLDTLERIQESFMDATKEELEGLAKKYLDASKLQVFVVADKNTVVSTKGGSSVTLAEDLRALAGELGLPYREIPLR